jgi:hypothetical protein
MFKLQQYFFWILFYFTEYDVCFVPKTVILREYLHNTYKNYES